MSVVAVTDYTFPSLEIEERILRAAGAELRAGNDRQITAWPRYNPGISRRRLLTYAIPNRSLRTVHYEQCRM
jgi:hypothetical protein